jgi:O-acetyl-ADP-ribose deacetylase (regulator of RNase III)
MRQSLVGEEVFGYSGGANSPGVHVMLFDSDLDSDDQQAVPNVVRAVWTRRSPRPLRVTLFEGDVTSAPSEAVCTSTNGRLSMMGGTGGDVLRRGGWSIRRECEAILAKQREKTGEEQLPPGTVWTTTAGRLAAQVVIHCVASDGSHRSSRELIRGCVVGAFSAAVMESCRSIAMPVFGTGHAAFNFDEALETMAAVLTQTAEPLDEVLIVIAKPNRVERAKRILDPCF